MKQIVLSIIIIMLTALTAQAQESSVPPLINYQGMLADATGNPLTGTKKLTFNIYDAPTGGNLIWGPQVFESVPLVNGRFNVILSVAEDGKSSVADAFSAGSRYLSIKVESNPEISPRQQILSAPYAIQAEHSAKADVAETVQGSDLYITSDGNIGIGTTTPSEKLEVAGKAKITGGLKPDYDSGWFAVQSNTDNTIALSHNLSVFPTHYTILFSSDNPPKDYVYDITASNWYDSGQKYNSAIHRGPRFSKTEMEIPLAGIGYVCVYWIKWNSWLFWKTGYYRVMLWK